MKKLATLVCAATVLLAIVPAAEAATATTNKSILTSADASDVRVNKTRIRSQSENSQSENSMNNIRVQSVLSQRSQSSSLGANVARKIDETTGQCKNCFR